MKALKEENKEFVYCNGYTTTLELYHFLYKNRDKIIFFDDSKNIFSTDIGLELLKACLFSVGDERIVRYSSTTDKLKVEQQFIFKGSLIVCINNFNWDRNADTRAVLDRVIYYNLELDYKEKIEMLEEIYLKPYGNSNIEDRKAVFDYIKKNTDDATTNLNFRLFFKLLNLYLFDKDDFEFLAKHIIFVNEDYKILVNYLKKYKTIKEAQKRWCEETGKSRASFFRLKKKVSKSH